MQSPTGEYTFTDLTKLLYHTVILHSKITPKRPQIMGNFPGSGIRNKQVSDIESGYPDIESGYPDIRI